MTMINAPSFRCDPERDGTFSARIACLDFKNRVVLVAGRADYCGVVKKSMFTVMNYLLPEMGDMGMHCSANIGNILVCVHGRRHRRTKAQHRPENLARK